ncbi:uncharacterized protein METZ01_LOCUS391109 [marine metagenome]|uniref:Uncharacterized protein n=1 Tax=marine metagenome TaxID=408172 RepID=A0A382UWX9_9ZZZZ
MGLADDDPYPGIQVTGQHSPLTRCECIGPWQRLEISATGPSKYPARSFSTLV